MCCGENKDLELCAISFRYFVFDRYVLSQLLAGWGTKVYRADFPVRLGEKGIHYSQKHFLHSHILQPTEYMSVFICSHLWKPITSLEFQVRNQKCKRKNAWMRIKLSFFFLNMTPRWAYNLRFLVHQFMVHLGLTFTISTTILVGLGFQLAAKGLTSAFFTPFLLVATALFTLPSLLWFWGLSNISVIIWQWGHNIIANPFCSFWLQQFQRNCIINFYHSLAQR